MKKTKWLITLALVLCASMFMLTACGDKPVAVTGVTLDKTTEKMFAGESVQLSATVAPINASIKDVAWTSSNEAVAVVTATGKVVTLSAGSANITVVTVDGNKSAVCAITVVDELKVAVEKAVNTSNFPNKGNINEMMTALWGTKKTTVQGIEVSPIFSLDKDGNLIVDGDKVSDGLKQWIVTQWGGTSVPVKLSYAFGKPIGKTTDANWDNSYTEWIDVATSCDMKKVSVNVSKLVTATYSFQVGKTPVVSFEKAINSSNFANKNSINEMMTALWGNAKATVQGIEIYPIFSVVDGKLTVNYANVSSGILQWVKAQWGGNCIPVQANFSVSKPTEIATDANWNSKYILWIDIKVAPSDVKISMANGKVAVANLVNATSYRVAQFVANTPNKGSVNEMMTALWSEKSSTVQGLNIAQVFSVDANGNLVANKANVKAGLLQWVKTQWGGSSVPVKVVYAANTNTAEKTDANWGSIVIWVDLAK